MADSYSLKHSRKPSHRPRQPNHSFDYQPQYPSFSDYGREPERQPKKQKISDLIHEYGSNSSGGSLNWNDQLLFLLLDVWGERFMELGRRSLRSEDWAEVADKVSGASRMEVSDVDCRKQLDALKRKYRKLAMEKTGASSYSWKFYKKMEMLMGVEMEENGLACGVDSGEYCFADTRVYLERSNAYDEMRDSPSGSEIEDDDDDEEEDDEEDDDLPPQRRGNGGEGMKVLVDSIERFGKLYEEIENNKREQMMELKKMRADFDREMEIQKKEILEKACADIAKIQEGGSDDDDDDEDEDKEINEDDDDVVGDDDDADTSSD